MKKQVFGRKFKRDKNERKALFKSLLSSLVIYERIKTTEQKAKAIKAQAEKLVTHVKKNSQNIESGMHKYLTADAIKKMITQIAPVFKERAGGYTRIVRLGRRFNDNASYVMLEWTEQPSQELRIKNPIRQAQGRQESKKEVIKKEQKKKETKGSKEIKKLEAPKKRTQRKSLGKTK